MILVILLGFSILIPRCLSQSTVSTVPFMSSEPRTTHEPSTVSNLIVEDRAAVPVGLPLATVWAAIRAAEQGERLHHSDECEPTLHGSLFRRLINLPRYGINDTDLNIIKQEIRHTCDWKRYMTCDPTRHRCVCSVDAIWVKREVPLTTPAGPLKGSCVLRANSKCYASSTAHANDPKNPLGVNPPFAPCINGTTCKNGTCKCVKPGTKECKQAENIFHTSVTILRKRLKSLNWAQYGDKCDLRSNLTFDLRVQTLRSLTIDSKDWMDNNVSFAQICDFHQALDCDPDNGDRLGTTGTCRCRKGTNRYQDQCKGEHGSLCEIRIWAEADAVPYEINEPCMPELTCTQVNYVGTETTVGACCYTGIFKYRTHEVNKSQMYLCSTGFDLQKTSRSTLVFFITFTMSISLLSH